MYWHDRFFFFFFFFFELRVCIVVQNIGHDIRNLADNTNMHNAKHLSSKADTFRHLGDSHFLAEFYCILQGYNLGVHLAR